MRCVRRLAEIFRHILDLANGQADRGHHVGIIADSLTGGERAEAALAEIAPRLKLGVRRVAIHREPHPADILVWARFMYLIWKLKPDVVHGHGAKAGEFIRMKARSKSSIRVYTPHGGSLHYPLDTFTPGCRIKLFAEFVSRSALGRSMLMTPTLSRLRVKRMPSG